MRFSFWIDGLVRGEKGEKEKKQEDIRTPYFRPASWARKSLASAGIGMNE